MKRAFLLMIAVVACAMFAACGSGNGGNNNNNNNNNNNQPMVSVSPATANVQEGSTQQFTASVINTTQPAVNWQVNGVTGGNASVGTISTTGLYTAPPVIPSPASVTVTAVLQADSNAFSNSIVTVTAVSFSNASLKGNYVLSLNGVDPSTLPFNLAGGIAADGNGNITAGEADLNSISSGYVQASSVTGSYTVGADGRGTLTLSVPALTSSPLIYAIAMRSLNNAVLNELDSNVIAATGSLEAQSAGPATPSGNYAFGFSGTSGGCTGGLTSAGLFILGSSLGGTQDVNCSGNITQSQSLSGSFAGIDAFGRGTGSFTGNTGTSSIVYYVVSPSRFRFVCSNSSTVFLGSADLQTQASFASTDFSGSYVMNISATTSAGVSYTLIQLNASGGNISSGYYDVNNTGTVGQASLNGAFSVGSNGRIGGTFNVNSSSIPFAMYMISPTQAYYVDERTNVVGSGSVYAQNSGTTTNAGWAGSYATRQFGYFLSGLVLNPANASGVSGQISADGNGNLAGTLDINDPSGVLQNQTLQGSYSVGGTAPGRATVTITTPTEGTRSYVGYVVDSGRVLLLETDNNVASSGDAIRQF